MKKFIPFLFPLLFSPAWACITPVYRFALENWPADPYQVTILYKGSLGQEGERLLEELQTASKLANIFIETVNLDEKPTETEELPPDESSFPWMIIHYPTFMGIDEPLWSAPFTKANVKTLLRSPLRERIAQYIFEGVTAVWVLVESGNKERDKKAEHLLREKLKEMEETLEPGLEEYKSYLETLGMPMDLKISFPIVLLSKGDPDEKLLFRMLSPPGLFEKEDQPVAFPVFGRGRVLCALIGDEINKLNIEDICGFLIGGCTCQVKGMCPGWDLLISADWEAAVEEIFTEEDSFGSFRRIIIILSAQLVVVVIGVWTLFWRKRKESVF